MTRTPLLVTASTFLVSALFITCLTPYDRTTWLLEVFPVLLALPILGLTYRRFPLTSLLYGCIFCHALVLIVGGFYSYARVPFGFQLADLLQIERNPYDKIGHFFQGFVPALIAREILVRGNHVSGKKMRDFLVICIVLVISASYELVEWAVAVVLGQEADEFLGTQGDMWNTQSDMLFALLGASTALLSLSRMHDRQITALQKTGDERMAPGQLEERLPVWEALSELFLDTELSAADYENMASRLAFSRYPVDVLEEILLDEVYPVCKVNLQVVAGEWAFFSPDWLKENITPLCYGCSLPGVKTWRRWMFGRTFSTPWTEVKGRIAELRRQSDNS